MVSRSARPTVADNLTKYVGVFVQQNSISVRNSSLLFIMVFNTLKLLITLKIFDNPIERELP